MKTFIVSHNTKKTWKCKVKANDSYEACQTVASLNNNSVSDYYAIKADAKI